jgi:hypothetical protein
VSAACRHDSKPEHGADQDGNPLRPQHLHRVMEALSGARPPESGIDVFPAGQQRFRVVERRVKFRAGLFSELACAFERNATAFLHRRQQVLVQQAE